MFETEGRLVKRKESDISRNPGGLAHKVEPQRTLPVAYLESESWKIVRAVKKLAEVTTRE